jgi:hypothetical protein
MNSLQPAQLFLLLFAVLPTAAQAELRVQLPIACAPNEDCWVVNYLDVDPASGAAADFRCGSLTYDGHDGTDFAIRDWQTMGKGVAVLAAADGEVLRIRDGMQDRQLSPEERRKLLEANRGCGNGVLIDHGGGWQTMYCHMKQGSIAVAPGERVRAGQKLGAVGHSGFVEFPHVHLSVFFNKDKIDPFTGASSGEGCNVMKQRLWLEGVPLYYQPVSIYAAGFKAGVPDFEAIKKDASSPETLPADVEALTLWAGLFGVVKGDRIRLEILDPKGRVFAEQDIVQDRTRARQFYYVGKRTDGLMSGNYTGTIRLERKLSGGETITREKSRMLTVK